VLFRSVRESVSDGLEEFERTLAGSPQGRHLLKIVRRHLRESLDLVNRRRRVTVVWQRNKGPAFVAAFLNMARSGGGAIPKTVAGYSLETLANALFDVLLLEGSSALSSAIEENRAFLCDIIHDCDNIEDLARTHEPI
jgi:hypothetical protein